MRISILLTILLSHAPLMCAVSNQRGRGHFRPIASQTTDNVCYVYQASQQLDPLTCSVEEQTTKFMQRCTVTLDCVVPLRKSKNCSVLTRPPPWVKGHVQYRRRACRCAEQKWKTSKLQDDFNDMKILLRV